MSIGKKKPLKTQKTGLRMVLILKVPAQTSFLWFTHTSGTLSRLSASSARADPFLRSNAERGRCNEKFVFPRSWFPKKFRYNSKCKHTNLLEEKQLTWYTVPPPLRLLTNGIPAFFSAVRLISFHGFCHRISTGTQKINGKNKLDFDQ